MKNLSLKTLSILLLHIIVISLSIERRAVPLLIFIFSLSVIFQKSSYKNLKLINNRFTWLSISFYLLLVLGLFHTENMTSGWFDLEVKFSILLFPLILPLVQLNRKQFGNLLFAYILGCFIAFVICLSMASIYYFSSYDPSVFYYDKLSVFHHPTYFSMYLNFSIIIFYYFLIMGKENFVIKSNVLLIILISVFSIFVVLLSSKMGLITLLIIIFVGTVLWFLKSRAIFPSILVFIMVSSFIYLSFNYSNIIQNRINEAVKSISEEDYSFSTTSARIAIWEIGVELVKEKPLIGYGTGDVKDELMNVYKSKEFNALYYKKLNCHNQYFQAGIALGTIGIIIFLISIFNAVPLILKKRNMLHLGFLFLIAANFLTESILETQAGVVFYAFFNSFLFFNQSNIKNL